MVHKSWTHVAWPNVLEGGMYKTFLIMHVYVNTQWCAALQLFIYVDEVEFNFIL